MDVLCMPRLIEERGMEDEALNKEMEGLPRTFVAELAKQHPEKEFTMSDLEDALRKASGQNSHPIQSRREPNHPDCMRSSRRQEQLSPRKRFIALQG